MLYYNIKPILVFDGAYLHMKGKMEDERKRNREEHKRKAEECVKEGNMTLAYKFFTIAVDITPEHAYLFV